MSAPEQHGPSPGQSRADPSQGLWDAVEASGLVEPGSSGIVLLSGGADSAALTFGLARAASKGRLAAGSPVALHVNYGLRPDSGEDEAAARELCDLLGIEILVERPPRGPGNLHAWAREARYAAAERLRAERDLDWIAVAHTRSDLAETVLYRLATSPGTRALAAMPARRAAVIRPLLGISRARVRALADAAGLPYVDDHSNDDPAFARARIRNEVLPVLEELNPAMLDAIAATRAELGEELDFIAAAAEQLLADADAIPGEDLLTAHPALRRHALRLLAGRRAGRAVPVSRQQAEEAERLVRHPEGGSVDLGGGVFIVAEGGVLAAEQRPTAPATSGAQGPLELDLPAGSARWGGWAVSAEPMTPPFQPAGPDVATLDSDRIGGRVEVRSWREGDCIHPLGMTGSKTLQDLFTDKGVRRSERRKLPVLVAPDGEIAWVPGLAVAEPFRITRGTARAVRLEAHPVAPAVSP